MPSESEYVPGDTSSSSSSTPAVLSTAPSAVTSSEPSTVPSTSQEAGTSLSSKRRSYNRKENKLRKVQGLPYVTRAGVQQSAKVFSPVTDCCKAQCFKNIAVEKQKALFDAFYSETNLNSQNQILKSGMSISPKKSTRINKEKPSGSVVRNRNVSVNYKISIADNKKIKVCKNFYTKLYGVTRAKIDVIVQKSVKNLFGFVGEDRRGKSEPFNKLKEDERQDILQHINSFPLYESHYSRRHTKRKYLQEGLNIKKMFELYVEARKELNTKVVSYDTYRKIFQSTGYRFKLPKIDTCQKCDEYNLKLKQKNLSDEERKEIECIYEQHKALADDAYTKKDLDKQLAKSDKEKRVLVFDLQQCLPTPAISANIVFYKRLLWVYNLTVRDCSKSETDCFMWHEAIAGRGSDQIASCLYKKISCLPESVKHVITYSDTCAGQNRNLNMTAMLCWAMQKHPHLEYIDQKFLIPGHTHLECDADHARIERAKKTSEMKIMVPRDWFNFVRTVRGKIPMQVHVMESDDFKQFSHIYKAFLTRRKKDVNNDPIKWLQIRWLRVTKSFGHIYFKYDLDETTPFKEMDFTRKIRGPNLKNFQIPNTYDDCNYINPEKKKDLISILNLIDSDCHEFYKKLKVKSDAGYNYLSEDDDLDE